MSDWQHQLNVAPLVKGRATSRHCTRSQMDRCKSELYQVMPGMSAAESLRLLETDRKTLIRQIEATLDFSPAGWVFLFNMVRAVTCVRLWVLLQLASGSSACFEDKYLKLRDWAYRIVTHFGHVSDWAQVDAWGERLVGAEIVDVKNVSTAHLDRETMQRLQRVWTSMLKNGDDKYAFWLRRLNQLPAELLAVALFWAKQNV